MFYSHQLLARKAPLGQIWMAATMHAKINRKKLNKLNIIKICEEILNPSVPMALRLSGILMGGVVIVYERKVKILYEDVTRLLVEINEAWKVKAAPDPTILPKGKSQAKKEAVTLPEKDPKDGGDLESQYNNFSTTSPIKFQQKAYFTMQLDMVDEPYVNDRAMEDDPLQHLYQTDAENITLFEHFDLCQTNTGTFNPFERFDIEGDEETQPNFTSGDHTQLPDTFIPSPIPREEYQGGHPETVEVQEENLEQRVIHEVDEREELIQHQINQEQVKRKTKRTAASCLDCEQTIIPGHIYQMWLQDISDLVSRSERKRKRTGVISTMKVASLMDFPSVVLSGGLIKEGNREIYYPAPLLELWMKSIQHSIEKENKSIQHPNVSPSERNSDPLPPDPSHPERVNFPNPMDFPFEDNQSGVGSQSIGISVEKLRAEVSSDNPAEIRNEVRPNFWNNDLGLAREDRFTTPGNSGNQGRSIPSSVFEDGFISSSEHNSARTSKKRHHSSSRQSSNGLDPVAEENSWHHDDDPAFKLTKYDDPAFKFKRLSEDELPHDQELLVETAPTQTQAVINHPVDKITDSIRMQMKAHFDQPGAPSVESLNHLAAGLNRKTAALLFYQTCVLASSDVIKVDQQVPYGDILISRGNKM